MHEYSIHEAPDSASRLVSFDADSYSHNVEFRSRDAESGASHTYNMTYILWTVHANNFTKSLYQLSSCVYGARYYACCRFGSERENETSTRAALIIANAGGILWLHHPNLFRNLKI